MNIRRRLGFLPLVATIPGRKLEKVRSLSFATLPAKAGWKPSTILIAVGAAFFVCCPWVTPARAEIFDGSGFEAINWNMHIADAERVIGSGVSRLRENTHSDYEYLRAANYQYLGCQYVLLLNFGPNGGTLSEIILTHRGDVKVEMAEKSCRDGLLQLREKIGRPTSVDHGVQAWRLKTTTVTVMEGRRGELQIRYKPN